MFLLSPPPLSLAHWSILPISLHRYLPNASFLHCLSLFPFSFVCANLLLLLLLLLRFLHTLFACNSHLSWNSRAPKAAVAASKQIHETYQRKEMQWIQVHYVFSLSLTVCYFQTHGRDGKHTHTHTEFGPLVSHIVIDNILVLFSKSPKWNIRTHNQFISLFLYLSLALSLACCLQFHCFSSLHSTHCVPSLPLFGTNSSTLCVCARWAFYIHVIIS